MLLDRGRGRRSVDAGWRRALRVVIVGKQGLDNEQDKTQTQHHRINTHTPQHMCCFDQGRS